MPAGSIGATPVCRRNGGSTAPMRRFCSLMGQGRRLVCERYRRCRVPLGLVHQLGERLDPWAQLIGDLPPASSNSTVGLPGRPRRGSNHSLQPSNRRGARWNGSPHNAPSGNDSPLSDERVGTCMIWRPQQTRSPVERDPGFEFYSISQTNVLISRNFCIIRREREMGALPWALRLSTSCKALPS